LDVSICQVAEPIFIFALDEACSLRASFSRQSTRNTTFVLNPGFQSISIFHYPLVMLKRLTMERAMKVLAVGIVPVLLACLSYAQKVEIFGGFSSEHIAPCGTQITASQEASCGLEQGELETSAGYFNGWEAAATFGLASHPFLGITADFAGHYGALDSQSSRYSFLFGPTFALQLSRLRPFAHALFGIEKQTTSPGNPYAFTKFDMALGGGLDVSLARHFSARLAQIDYEWQKNPTSGLPGPNGFRLATGLVFKF
jgi:hypothetical protein